MIVLNYTRTRKRDKKYYQFMNANISAAGIGAKTVKTSGFLLAIFTVLGAIYCSLTGTIWYNPLLLADGTGAGYFYMVFVGAPIGIGIALNSVKVQNYKLVDYLIIYFAPKHPIDQSGRKLKITGYEVSGFVEKL